MGLGPADEQVDSAHVRTVHAKGACGRCIRTVHMDGAWDVAWGIVHVDATTDGACECAVAVTDYVVTLLLVH